MITANTRTEPDATFVQNKISMLREKLRHIIGGLLANRSLAHAHDSLSAKLGEWNDSLCEIERESEVKPEVAISVVGGTGAGKSTLINALLGVRLLPTSSMEACTAAISELRYEERSDFSVEVEFISRDDWKRELGMIRAEIKDVESAGSDVDKSRFDAESDSKAAWNKIKAVYGSREKTPTGNTITLKPDINNLVEPAEIKAALDAGRISIVAPDLQTLSERIHNFLSSQERFWAITKRVRVSGKFDVLRNGAVIIDLPGINDPNAAREEITRNYIKTSQFIWVVFNIKRILTKDTMQLLQSDEFRQIVMDGKADALSFVGTHSDDVNFDSAWKELGLPEEATDDQVVDKRNQLVRRKVADQLDELATQLARDADAPHNAEVITKTFRKAEVFTVSANDYLKMITKSRRGKPVLSTEEMTQIPLLQFHMQEVCEGFDSSAHYRKCLKHLDALNKAVVQDLEERRFGARQAATTGKAERERRITTAKSRLDFLRDTTNEITTSFAKDITGREATLTDSIERGVVRARNSMDSVFSRWQGMYWSTIRAVVRRGGRFHGSTGMHDFALDLSRPILDQITFVWSDFFGNALQQCLTLWTGRLETETKSYYDELLMIAEADKTTTTSFRNAIDIMLNDETSRLRGQMNAYITQDQKSLYDKLPDEIREKMRPAFDEAAQESGTGMKNRMVAVLRVHADTIADEMFDTAQSALIKGVNEMSSTLSKDFEAMGKKVYTFAVNSQRKMLAQDLSEEDIQRAEASYIVINAALDTMKNDTVGR